MENKGIQLPDIQMGLGLGGGDQEVKKCPELWDFEAVLIANEEGTAYEGLEIWDHEHNASVCYINLKNRTVTVCAEGVEGPRTFKYLESEEFLTNRDYWK